MSQLFQAPPLPPTPHGRYRVLPPPFAQPCVSFRSNLERTLAISGAIGAMDKEISVKLLDAHNEKRELHRHREQLEVIDNLHHLVTAGKVLYLGISDTPAWLVSYVNQYAKASRKTPFSIYQGAWNIMQRSLECDISLCLVSADSPLRNGVAGCAQTRKKLNEKPPARTDAIALEKVANKAGAKHITAVAIAYVMQKTPYVFPIIGGRKVEYLMANIGALSIALR
ncbi:uncharacterized protein FOMMEDRAFT_153886 [Fomitiporia mediterranea MF3/22]|uniref:uncharacterized protein n=1 Tax=Fomitiporia mediterranea (strain MF3/22) TaxID=694068 RepID=UPI0004407B54|nr:uncharacterized protein FOMMEDRAFT_153886 [Fomitiporia mediterranea MF3/22]EJD04794.1 hypothetical protein FOMMEDRAFT_153886 [Fomitiporia mediterranea MF3/22]